MNKDIETYKREQEIRGKADLKAKLEMVEVRKTSRPLPRKIGTMICDTGVKDGYRQATASFVLRLDHRTGEFIAEHGDTLYVSKSRDALKAKMDEVARVTLDLKWTRYLLVEYSAKVPYCGNWDSTTSLGIDDHDRHAVTGALRRSAATGTARRRWASTITIATLSPAHYADLRLLHANPCHWLPPIRRSMFVRLGLIRQAEQVRRRGRPVRAYVLTMLGERTIGAVPVAEMEGAM